MPFAASAACVRTAYRGRGRGTHCPCMHACMHAVCAAKQCGELTACGVSIPLCCRCQCVHLRRSGRSCLWRLQAVGLLRPAVLARPVALANADLIGGNISERRGAEKHGHYTHWVAVTTALCALGGCDSLGHNLQQRDEHDACMLASHMPWHRAALPATGLTSHADMDTMDAMR